jgi:hypothetical protein
MTETRRSRASHWRARISEGGRKVGAMIAFVALAFLVLLWWLVAS